MVVVAAPQLCIGCCSSYVFRTCGLWQMFVIAPSYFGSHVAAYTPASTMPDSGYNKITTASASPLDYACPAEPQRMVFRIKWDARWYSKWSQSLWSLRFFSSLAAGLASIRRIKALLTLPRSPLSWMLSDSSSCFWPSSQIEHKAAAALAPTCFLDTMD